jgi:hypothetical protein
MGKEKRRRIMGINYRVEQRRAAVNSILSVSTQLTESDRQKLIDLSKSSRHSSVATAPDSKIARTFRQLLGGEKKKKV